MKVKSPSLLFNSAVKLMAMNAATVPVKNRPTSRMRTFKVRAIFLVLLAVLSWARLSPAQSSGQIGLPVIFVHGICGTADSFLQDEEAVKAMLQSHYKALYPTAQAPYSDEYITFYDGSSVWFQIPTKDLQDPESPNPIVTVPSSTRFFVVALDDPNQSQYQNFNPNITADIPIYTKGNELANIIWKIKLITGTPRVIVVAHSMGGLDTRAYIEGLASPTGSIDAAVQYFNDIAALVTIDTPHGGATSSVWDAAGILVNGVQCAANPSIDKSEMLPSGTDWITGTASVMPQLNYQTTGANSLPPALTVTSIASYWYNPGSFFPPLDELTDDVLGASTQDLASSLSNPSVNSASELTAISNQFATGQSCIPLHLLSCTGSAPQTLGYLEGAVFPLSIMTSGQLQISPATPTVGSGKTLSFSETTGAPIIWSILEGAKGGNIDPSYGDYQAPVNHTSTTETFHVVAINSQNPSQYAEVPVNVTSSSIKSATTTVLIASASQVPVGVSLTINATVQASGGTPTGTVTFYDGGKSLSTAILNNAGMATCSTSSLSLGSHSITAQYIGDSNYSASTTSSAVTITVVAVAPQLSVSPTSGTPGVTPFVKTDVGFTPYGLITHTATLPDNSVSVLTTNADGNGTYSYSRTYSMIGSYSQIDTDGTTGKATTPATWTVSPVTVNDFSLSPSPGSETISQGGSATFSLVTATLSGSAQGVSLSASNAPSGMTVSFSQSVIASGGAVTFTVSAGSSVPVGTYLLTITGTGTSATHSSSVSVTVVQQQSSSAGSLASSPTSFNFNPQTVDTASSPVVFSLVNSGGTAVTVSSLTASPGFIPSFLNGLGIPITLQPNGGYANMQVVFIPTSAGTETGTIKLFNSTNTSPLTISLSGSGIGAPVTAGNIQINATFNGSPWSGSLYTSLNGPESYTDGQTPITHSELAPGGYTESYSAGGPGGAALQSITPSASQTLTTGSTITFTYNFTGTNTFNIGDPQPITTVMGTGESAQIQLPQLCLVTGAAQTIQFSMQGLPLGASVAWSANPLSLTGCGQTETATITTSNTTPPGVYNIQITGKNQSDSTSTTSAWLSVNVPPASPDALVSVASNGTQGNGDSGRDQTGDYLSLLNAVSADGHVVAFVSTASNLAPLNGSTIGTVSQIYVRDNNARTTILASAATDGTQANYGALRPALSQDGRYLAFQSYATNLPNASSGGNNAIYVRDLTAGTIVRVDMAPDGTPGNGISVNPSISADGRFVAFRSTASNLIPGVSGGIFVLDRTTGQYKLASVSSDGSDQTSGDVPQISASGRYVLFASSDSNLVPNDTNGRTDAFVHDFVTGETTRVNVASDGTQDNCGIITSTTSSLAISADGRYVAFYSCGTALAPGYTDPKGDGGIFVHDMVTSKTTPLGIDQSNDELNTENVGGFSADGRFVAVDGSIVDQTTGEMTRVDVLSNGSGSPAVTNTVYYGGDTTIAFLSPDGSHTVFASNASNLVSNDSNGHYDVFEGVNAFVASPRLTSISLSSNDAPGGSQVTGTLTLNAPAPIGGAAVSVWTDNTAAQVPATVVVPSGTSSASFSITTSEVPAETVGAVLASYYSGSGVALLTLEPAPELSVSPSTWDFGYQAVGTSSATESFALSNSGTAALSINSVQLATGQVFKISSNTCGSSIVAGGGCSVSVTFDPSASGSASDAVQISYGNPATTFSISLTGNGATPVAALTPAPLNFGNQSMPGSSTEVATLTNSGNASLSSISASISGTNAGDFSISSDRCSGVVLPANSNCLVTVSFSPKAKGNRAATLSIADSASGSPQTISLTGTGVQSTPTLLWSPSAASITYGTPLGTGVLDATANQSGSNLAGTFAYTATMSSGTPQTVTQATVLGAGIYTLTTTFTPTDATDYTTATATTTLTVNKATSSVTTWPTASSITYGQTLAFSTLSGGQSTPAGSFTFTSPTTAPGTGTASQDVTFTPTDTTDYSTLTGTASVTVNKATSSVTTWPTASSISYGQTLSSSTLSGGVSTPAGSFAFTTPTTKPGVGTASQSVTFTPTDTTDYSTLTGTASVMVSKASSSTALVSSVNPSAVGQSVNFTATITGQYGGTATGSVTFSNGNTSLGSVSLNGGTASVASTALPLGTDTITAVYGGDTNFSGSTSNSVGQVVEVVYPVPILSGISPAFTNAGGAAFTLTVTGSGFVSNSTVYWGTTALVTTYGTATQLTAQVPATDIATGGTTAAITAQTPSPGGGTSNSFQFEVNSASGSTTGPTFSSTTATVTAGSPASYPVTLPSSVESASVTCLNLPTGATCSYSATTNTLTITTSSTTPKGTYQITVVFTETVSGAATSWILLPILLLPLVYLRRKLAARGVWVTACLGLVLLAAVAYTSGCGGSSGGSSSPPPPQTHQVVSSGSVSITIQ